MDDDAILIKSNAVGNERIWAFPPISVLLAFALCGRFHLLAAMFHFLQNSIY